ncbi:MAG: hypothetical protein RBS01_04270 [Candidatus Dojkabacteria bacterium]|jgi:hypothetical protein|nr:hypothetical protein [Candidatus Dojkabacteria bacterium]
MKKILTGFLGLFLVIGIVAGAGYAVFSSTTTMRGMVLGTATPGLKIGTDKLTSGTTTYYTTLPVDGRSFFKLLTPGEMEWGEFYLQNTSNADGDPIDFSLKGRITTAGGDWGVLKDVVKMRICYYSDTPDNHCNETKMKTAWMTLAEWNSVERTLPGPLIQGVPAHYSLQILIDSSIGNSIAGKTITGMNFDIIGTQVL